MPTRKQRRRDQKLRRHEYEEVYVDAEGREIPVEEVERAPKAASPAKPSRNGAVTRDARGRAIRPVPPPSWSRAFRRWAIFGPLLVVVLVITSKGGHHTSQLAVGVVYAIALLPFMYLVDRMTYRLHLRRVGDPQSQQKSSPRKRPAK